MVRSSAIACCLLIAVCPSLVWAKLAEHSLEHARAHHDGRAHWHPDGHVPHHEHGPDGSPLPVPEQGAAFIARHAGPALSELLDHFSVELPGFAAPLAIEGQDRDLPQTTKAVSLRPPRPSPGNLLPLLI